MAAFSDLGDIHSLLSNDLKAVDALTHETLQSNVPLIKEVVDHILNAGGKRMRLLLVLLAARLFDYQGQEHYELAIVIEFIHTATLLHDDVIDKSSLRRGSETANEIWGNPASVLVGDFLYSRAFQLLATRTNIPVMKLLAGATNALVEGEVWQLMNCNDPDIKIDVYLNVIRGKTARLFEAATQIGAMIASDDQADAVKLANYGLNLGMAFQIVDDLMDYISDARLMGKNAGDDFAEGKLTLPLIYAAEHSSPELQDYIRQCIKNGGEHVDLQRVSQAVIESGAKDYTLKVANEYLQSARASIKGYADNTYKQALLFLCDFVVARNN